MCKLYKLYFLLFFSSAYAACNKLPGTMICENGIEPAINANGNVILKHVHVTGDTTVKGQLFVENSKLLKLEIFGFLQAQNTTFLGPVTIWSNQAKITGGSAKNIRISGNSAGQTSLILAGDLTVNGDISFSGDAGVVLVDNQVHLMGKVIGGVVKKTGG
tara:strand:- start:637 stop:1116 length:480 start_codon:yes stop_codon:yes gene_type:complete